MISVVEDRGNDLRLDRAKHVEVAVFGVSRFLDAVGVELTTGPALEKELPVIGALVVLVHGRVPARELVAVQEEAARVLVAVVGHQPRQRLGCRAVGDEPFWHRLGPAIVRGKALPRVVELSPGFHYLLLDGLDRFQCGLYRRCLHRAAAADRDAPEARALRPVVVSQRCQAKLAPLERDPVKLKHSRR
jgi:hypothetical protein